MATNETQEYQGQMIGTTVDGVPLRVRVNDQGELVINLEAATVNIGDVDILSIAPGTNVIGKVIPSDADGDEKFTDANPASVKLTGSLTTVTHSAATCGVNTGAMLAANANRKYALIINDSDTTIYLKIGAAAVLNQGIRINANGGSYEMASALGNLNTGAINGITTAASKNVIVTEGV